MNSTPSRSALLSSLLGVLTIAALLTLFGYLSVWYRMLILYPHWAAFTFLAISVLRLLSIAAIWYWSRVGIIVYLLLAAGSFAVCASGWNFLRRHSGHHWCYSSCGTYLAFVEAHALGGANPRVH